MFRRACLAAFVFAALLTPTVVVQQRHVESAGGPAPVQTTGKVIVRFRPNASLSTVGNAFEAARTEVVASTAGSRLVLVAPTSGQTLDGAVAQLRGRADV